MSVARWHIRTERLIATAISLALIISAAGFVYVAGGITSPPRFASAAIDMALLFYVIAGTDIPQKIRESPILRRQLLVWASWLMILGVAPALNPQAIPPVIMALVAGIFMSAISIGALFLRDSD